MKEEILIEDTIPPQSPSPPQGKSPAKIPIKKILFSLGVCLGGLGTFFSLYACSAGRKMMRTEAHILEKRSETKPRILRRVLPNGLEVVLLEDHSAPVVAFQFWVRFGSADENPDYAGVAHVFEHMLFKGTERYPHGEIGALIEGAGGVVNAWTSYDETVYHVTLSSRYLEIALDVLTDAILNSRFDPEELRKEIEVVQEEIRRGKDSPEREVIERLLAISYTNHPYRRPVIGYPETVSKITREAMLEVYHTWYVPNNMVFVAVGDFDPDIVWNFLEKRFSDRPARELPPRPRQRDPRFSDEKAISFTYPADLYRFEIAFYGVEATDPRAPALDLLADLLSNGYNSLLYQRLKREENLTLEVFAYNYTPEDPGLFSAGASFTYDQLKKAIPRLLETILSLREIEVDPQMLSLAKSRMISQFIHNRETYQGIARTLGEFTLVHRDPYYDETYIENLKRIEPRDLKLVAREILTPSAYRAVLLNPENQPFVPEEELRTLIADGIQKGLAAKGSSSSIPRTTPTLVSNSSPTTTFPIAPSFSQPQENVRILKYPFGPTIVVQTDRKAPLVTLRAILMGGQLFEPKGKEGIANLTARLLSRGTSNLSAGEIEDELDRIGAVFSAGSDRDSITLALRVPREHFSQGWSLFFELLLHPTFPEKELEREREDMLQAIRALPEQKFSYALSEFLRSFYEGHPYDHLSIGRESGVKGIQRSDLIAFYRAHLSPDRIVFAIVGDLKFEEVEPLLQSPEFLEITSLNRFPSPLPPPPSWKGFSERVLERPGNQTHILWGFPVVSFREEDRYPLSVLDAILSGMGGRLFVELRDKESLAYAVTSLDAYPYHPGYFILYIGCAPEKESSAISGFARILDDIQKNGVTREEVERAQRYLTGVLDVSLQSTWNRSGSFAGGELFYGKWNFYEEYRERILKVNPSDVQKVAQRYLNPQNSLRVILRGKRS
jgi:zinc protease